MTSKNHHNSKHDSQQRKELYREHFRLAQTFLAPLIIPVLLSGKTYEFIKSQRGKNLILIDGYTYAQMSSHGWGCSTHKPRCKAKLRVDPNAGHLAYVVNEHCHPPRQFTTNTTGEVIISRRKESYWSVPLTKS